MGIGKQRRNPELKKHTVMIAAVMKRRQILVVLSAVSALRTVEAAKLGHNACHAKDGPISNAHPTTATYTFVITVIQMTNYNLP